VSVATEINTGGIEITEIVESVAIYVIKDIEDAKINVVVRVKNPP
jgi:hypothetical protein